MTPAMSYKRALVYTFGIIGGIALARWPLMALDAAMRLTGAYDVLGAAASVVPWRDVGGVALAAILVAILAATIIKAILLPIWLAWALYEETGIFGHRGFERAVKKASAKGGAVLCPRMFPSLSLPLSYDFILDADEVAERLTRGYTLTEQGKIRFLNYPDEQYGGAS